MQDVIASILRSYDNVVALKNTYGGDADARTAFTEAGLDWTTKGTGTRSCLNSLALHLGLRDLTVNKHAASRGHAKPTLSDTTEFIALLYVAAEDKMAEVSQVVPATVKATPTPKVKATRKPRKTRKLAGAALAAKQGKVTRDAQGRIVSIGDAGTVPTGDDTPAPVGDIFTRWEQALQNA